MKLEPLTSFEFDLPLILDNTQITAFRKCQRYFFYTYMNHLRSSSDKALPLVFGGAFAGGLEDYRRKRHDQHPHKEALESAYATAVLKWGDNPDVFPTAQKDPRTLMRCLEALRFYTEHYPFESDVLQPHPSENGGFEFSFALELLPEWGFPLHPSGSPFIYSGRIDMLGTYSGMPIINDEKTTARIQSNWPELWPIRHQFAGYVWALKKLGHGTHQVLVRGLGIHTKDFVPIEGGPYRFQNFLLEKFEDDLRSTIADMVIAYENVTLGGSGTIADVCAFSRNWSDACTSYNRICHFSNICFGNPDHEMAWLRSLPREKWEPIAR